MKMTQNIQYGFSLITAIFLLVVIALLGTAAVTLSTTQQQSAALDVLGSRAYQAAYTGIQWGAFQVLPNSAVGFAQTCRAGSASAVIPLTGNLANFTNVEVDCTSSLAVSEANATVTVYQITSTASGVAGATVGAQNYIERQIRVTIAP